jgi:ArsR family transcriptional regulator
MSRQALPLAGPVAAACCPPLAVQILDPGSAARLAPMFKALGDPVRLRLLSLIASRPEICVCDLTGMFDLTGPTISHHLKVLREAGLVGSERRGTWVYYWLHPGVMAELSALLQTTTATENTRAVASTA